MTTSRPQCVFARILASVVFLAAGSASAGESAEWGPYVEADMGTTYFNVGKGRLDNWSAVTADASRLDKGDRGYSLAVGFRFSPYIAVEAAYMDLGRSSYLVEDAGGSATLGFGSRGAAVSVLGTWPINRTFALEGRGGLYFGESKLRAWIAAGFDIDESGDLDWWLQGAGGGNPALLLGVGAVASFGPHWAVRLSYDYIYGDAVALRNSGLDAGMNSSVGRVALGLRYLF